MSITTKGGNIASMCAVMLAKRVVRVEVDDDRREQHREPVTSRRTTTRRTSASAVVDPIWFSTSPIVKQPAVPDEHIPGVLLGERVAPCQDVGRQQHGEAEERDERDVRPCNCDASST